MHVSNSLLASSSNFAIYSYFEISSRFLLPPFDSYILLAYTFALAARWA